MAAMYWDEEFFGDLLWVVVVTAVTLIILFS